MSARRAVRLYSRTGCGLCEQAELAVGRAARRHDVAIIDIDEDPELVARYDGRVPVLTIDEREVAEGRITSTMVRRSLRRSDRRTAARRRS